MNSWIQLLNENQLSPSARWGHSMCKLNENIIFMFGGYAGINMYNLDSVYFNDIWLFDLRNLMWK